MDLTRVPITRRRLLENAAAGTALIALSQVGCGNETPGSENGPSSPIARSPGDCGVRPGFVSFPADAVVSSNASAADEDELRATIIGAWRAYSRVDARGLKRFLAEGCVRMSGRWGAGTMQRSADAIAAGLADEAQAYERPTGVIAAEHLISDAELWVDSSGTAATALYWDRGPSGYRWCDDEQGVVLQAFTREGGRWRISHWTDSFATSYDLDADAPGSETFRFDFSYPVRDLGRAVEFYAPLVGAPESVDSGRAVFVLAHGSRFVLDSSGLGGAARPTDGLPNGWATVYVEDAASERDRLEREGVRFASVGEALIEDGPDRYAVGLDKPDRNPFVLMERKFSASGPSPRPPRGFTGADPGVRSAHEIATAWVEMDGARIDTLYGPGGRLLDDTRIKTRGFETGSGVAPALAQVYWPRYDRSPNGLSVELVARDIVSRRFGDRTVVSYVQELTGTGAHPFRETALVTHLLDADESPLISFTVTSDAAPKARVLGPDYIGYPTTAVRQATERFYSRTMGFGQPYVDQAYRGWWSDNGSVYGTYAARRSRDRMPRPGRTSAYNSFWVRSARDTYSYLKRRRVNFPRIPAITGHRGIQAYPGYKEVVATDSEGNAVVFTEYTGR